MLCGAYVCTGIIHQNIKRMIEGSQMKCNPALTHLIGNYTDSITYKHLLSLMTCNSSQPACFLNECFLCESSRYSESGDYCHREEQFEDGSILCHMCDQIR